MATAYVRGVTTMEDMDTEPKRRPTIDVTNEPDAVRQVRHVLHSGAISDVYLRGRAPVWIGESDEGPYVEEVTRDALTLKLLNAADVVRYTAKGGERSVLLPPRVASIVLANNQWRLPRLKGITSVPLLGPEGEFHLTEGYNPVTGYFYAPKLPVKDVPEQPTADDLRQAQELIVGKMLGDFPWKSSSDLAHYVGSLFVPMLRAMISDPTPLWCVTATNPGSGKSYLTGIHSALYGASTASWGSDNNEQQKIITSLLMGSGSPVAVFDNVPSGHVLRYPCMSELITAKTWSGRVLGKSEMASIPNNVVWFVNGNNLAVGDDLARRTLFCKLDPDVRPDTRTADTFAVGDLNEWLPLNAPDVLRALLVVLRGWVAAGMPRTDDHIASFGAWPRTIGGILRFMQLPGWLENREEQMQEADEDAQEWTAFLSRWHEHFGAQEIVTASVLDAAFGQRTDFGSHSEGPLTDVIPRDGDRIPSKQKLGRWLKAREGRHFGEYRLRSRYDRNAKVNMWHVDFNAAAVPEPRPEATQTELTVGAAA